jgi:hypothetical protein
MAETKVKTGQTTAPPKKGWWRRFLEKLAESNRKSLQSGCKA